MNMKPLALAAVLLMVPGIALARGGHGHGAGGFGPFPFTGADMAEQIAALDADGDGALDADEFDNLLREQRQRMLDALLHRCDGDGKASAEEFASVPMWFEHLDRDDDGALDEDELARLERRGWHGCGDGRGDGPRDGNGPRGNR